MTDPGSSLNTSSAAASAALLVQLVQEIEQTPAQYWASLLKTIRQFRQGLEATPSTSEQAWNEALQAAAAPSPERQVALRHLLNAWMEDEDEQEQAEAWQFLHQALDSDRLSDRVFFP